MANIEVYTKDYCPYCVKAMNLLRQKGVDFTEIDITNDTVRQAEMMTRAAPRRTVPQIFINGTSIGGCDDLYALDGQGKLDELLRA
jgi:glutaredoxin 3